MDQAGWDFVPNASDLVQGSPRDDDDGGYPDDQQTPLFGAKSSKVAKSLTRIGTKAHLKDGKNV